MRELIANLNADKNIYGLVITGAGEKFFSAGADLKMFASGDKAVAQDIGLKFGQAFEALADFRGVSIAAINGFAMGGRSVARPGSSTGVRFEAQYCFDHQ